MAATQLDALRPGVPFGLPNLRRNVCPHFYMTGPRGPIPVQTPHLLKAYMRQDGTIARCQVRGGVHLDAGYDSTKTRDLLAELGCQAVISQKGVKGGYTLTRRYARVR